MIGKSTWFRVIIPTLMQMQSSIAEVVVDGSLKGTEQPLTGPNYVIEQSLGQTQGSNLFHSFSQFNINTGESANFQASSAINNIFARVTGGNLSIINGEISSNSSANLWLINPAGWLIGKNAAINLPGDFHLSTATGLDFKDGGVFLADLNNKSSLSIAEPIDYQFQNAEQAAITIDQANITMKEGMSVSLMGGDIQLKDAHISAPSGRILLASNAGSEGKWQLDEQGLTQLSGQRGNISIASNQSAGLDNPTLSINEAPLGQNAPSTHSHGSSKIELNADQLALKNAFVTALVRNNAKQGGGAITLAGETINLTHSRIFTSVSGDQPGGNISVKGKDLFMTGSTDSSTDGSILKTDTRFLSNGQGGSITIDLSRALHLSAQSSINSATLGNGEGGNIVVNSPLIELNEQSSMSVETALGKGQAGTMTIRSQDLSMHQDSFLESSSAQEGQGNAGTITVFSPHISLDHAYILSESDDSSSGATGNISINPDNGGLTMSVNDGFLNLHHSFVATTNRKTLQGDGGNISIDAGTLVMSGGYIQANSAALNGSGGKVTVNAQRTLFSQEQFEIGGNERKSFLLQPDLNIIQAAAPQGESGQVSVSRVELNIAGQLAKVDANFANNRPVANDPCTVARGEETSSLIQTGNGGLAPNAGDPVSLPLQRHAKKAP